MGCDSCGGGCSHKPKSMDGWFDSVKDVFLPTRPPDQPLIDASELAAAKGKAEAAIAAAKAAKVTAAVGGASAQAIQPVASGDAAALIAQLNRFATASNPALRLTKPLASSTQVTVDVALATLTVLVHRFSQPQAVLDPGMTEVLATLGQAYLQPTRTVAAQAGEYGWLLRGYADRLGLPPAPGTEVGKRPTSKSTQLAIGGLAALLIWKATR